MSAEWLDWLVGVRGYHRGYGVFRRKQYVVHSDGAKGTASGNDS
jgi:hypothetical protein